MIPAVSCNGVVYFTPGTQINYNLVKTTTYTVDQIYFDILPPLELNPRMLNYHGNKV